MAQPENVTTHPENETTQPEEETTPPDPDLRLDNFRDINNGKELAYPIHAEFIMSTKRNFAAGEISLKGFWLLERSGEIVFHQLFLDELLDAIPTGVVHVRMYAEPLTTNNVPTWLIAGESEIHFVFYRNGEEIIRYTALVDMELQHTMPQPKIVRNWTDDTTILYTVDEEM